MNISDVTSRPLVTAVMVLFTAIVSVACPDVQGETTVNTSVQSADSTATVTAWWSGEADEWEWRVPDVLSDRTTERITTFSRPRADTSYTEDFCVRGVNTTDAGEAVGPEVCESYTIPALGPTAPDAPVIDSIEVDTVMTMADEQEEAWLFARWSPHDSVLWYRTYVEDDEGTLISWRNENNWSPYPDPDNPPDGYQGPHYPWASTGLDLPRRAENYEAKFVIEGYAERGDYKAWPPEQSMIVYGEHQWTVPAQGECRDYRNRVMTCRTG